MVYYTSHAIDKLETAEAKNFKISKVTIEKVLKKPRFQKQLPTGVIRASGLLDEEHSLCVIYRLESENIKVITFFPSQKGRYEN